MGQCHSERSDLMRISKIIEILTNMIESDIVDGDSELEVEIFNNDDLTYDAYTVYGLSVFNNGSVSLKAAYEEEVD